jgi:hypothetical protein
MRGDRYAAIPNLGGIFLKTEKFASPPPALGLFRGLFLILIVPDRIFITFFL